MKNFSIFLILSFCAILGASTASGQGISYNATGAPANASAILDVASTTQGMLVPRMTMAQRNAIASPATGLLIYQTDGTPGFYYYTGSAWTAVGGTSLPSGTDGQILQLVGGVPTWVSPAVYFIVANSVGSGSISPSGISMLIPGASQVFTITPVPPFVIDSVFADGAYVGTASTYTFSSVSANHTISAKFTLNVGAAYEGGIVAYILAPGDPGYSSTTIHGLIAAPADQSTGIAWTLGAGSSFSGMSGAIGGGAANTTTIVTAQGVGNYAAYLCDTLTLGGYTDWYLPNTSELTLLYNNRTAIGGFASDKYWTSIPFGSTGAFYYDFNTGTTTFDSRGVLHYVRAIRKF